MEKPSWIWICFFIYGVVSSAVATRQSTSDDELKQLDDDIQKISLSSDKPAGKRQPSPMDAILKINEETDAISSTIYVDELAPPEEKGDETGEFKRNAVKSRSMLWPGGIIPYKFDVKFKKNTLNNYAKLIIESAMRQLAKVSCIKFRLKTAKDNGTYLLISKRKGCYSYVGRLPSHVSVIEQNGGQVVSIGSGCQYKGIVMHELLHAVGFYHEQSRYDRDQFVHIHWDNIKKSAENNFIRRSKSDSDNLQTYYDYGGIMHYGAYYFAINRMKKTISVTSKGKRKVIGNRAALTSIDVEQLKRLYRCGNSKIWSGWSSYFPCNIPAGGNENSTCETKRTRFCPKGYCPGKGEEVKTCTDEECKRNGFWSPWSRFGECNMHVECNSGAKTRKRSCNSPTPLKGGLACPGDYKQIISCEYLCPTNCSLDEHLCSYRISRSWKHISGNTPTAETGPDDDVTGGGKYLYTEVSGNYNKYFTIASPEFTASGGEIKCYSFYYHMYGRDIGSLEVYLHPEYKLLFAISGNQDKLWHRKQLDVLPAGNFKIVFLSKSGRSYLGDIAIDQMILTNSSCDRCSVAHGGCHDNATCTNAIGSSNCSCNRGFSGNGIRCTDIDECSKANGGCHDKATCKNTIGSRTCTCYIGFYGNGTLCIDINECSAANGGCHDHATCTNTIGSSTCACNRGFSGNGIHCNDINECSKANGGCHDNAICTNTIGSRTCICKKPGFSGNGILCNVVHPCDQPNKGGCSQGCKKMKTSYVCQCQGGFVLSDDGRTCNNVVVQAIYLGKTNWGQWGRGIFCPYKVYVKGFRLQVEPKLGNWRDDSALNGIQLHCADGTQTARLSGIWGSWRGWKNCGTGKFVTGFNFRSESNQGYWGDDTAGNDVAMKCSDGTQLYGGGLNWGSWDSHGYKTCKDGSYFCGVQAKIQSRGIGDATALNRLKYLCCK